MKTYLYWVHLPDQTINEGYLGVSNNYIRRWKEHTTKNLPTHFCYAVKKYKDTLVWEVLFEGTNEECYLLESQLRFTSGIGWNTTPGGAIPSNLNQKASAETRKKISDAKLGHTPWNKGKTDIYSDETLAKIGKATKARTQGKDNPMYGKTHTQEVKDKLSKLHKGKRGMIGSENPSARPVICLTTGIIYDTITEGAKSINVSIGALANHLKGRTKTCGGQTWDYHTTKD